MARQRLRVSPRTDVRSVALWAAITIFAAIGALIGFDIAADYRAGTARAHLATEGVVMALSLGGIVVMWRQFHRAAERADRLAVDLEAARRDAERFRAEAAQALKGLGEAIDRQFERWGLTPAEREVGLLLLKGLAHKEIAEARATSETTIRQQALAVYRKSGLRSRAELSAFFLEDLLLPVGQR